MKQRHVIFAALIKQNIVREHVYRVSYVKMLGLGYKSNSSYLIPAFGLLLDWLTSAVSYTYLTNVPWGMPTLHANIRILRLVKGKKMKFLLVIISHTRQSNCMRKMGKNRWKCFEEIVLGLTCPLGSKKLAMPLQMSVCHTKETESIYQQNFSISYVLLPKL